jgi:hypothetical protein
MKNPNCLCHSNKTVIVVEKEIGARIIKKKDYYVIVINPGCIDRVKVHQGVGSEVKIKEVNND